MKKNIILVLLFVVILSVLAGFPKDIADTISDKLNESADTSGSNNADDNSKKSDVSKGNLILVNRDNALSENYSPKDLVTVNVRFYRTASAEEKTMRKEAAEALEELFRAAQNEGIELYGLNGYRSYDTQKNLYNKDCRVKGKSYADQYDAKPGHSEHQTGLAMDVTNKTYSYGFQTTREGKWLAKNCYKYGFILRYPEGKEGITGYSYEPWHIRYVGRNAAKQIFSKGIVLEQYLN